MKIGICDTMFAIANMGALAEHAIIASGKEVEIERYTVPGMKDLPVASKKMIEEKKCDIIIALAMVGKEDIDERCAQEASFGLIQAELQTNTHILKVFVHEREAYQDNEKLLSIMKDRTIKHTQNALDLLFDPKSLIRRAGTGQRQGSTNVQSFKLEF